MQIDRATIIQGPAILTKGGQTFWSKGNITLKPVFTRFAIDTSIGKVDERFSDRKYTIAFEPAGRFTAPLVAVLWPYQASAVGTSVFGAVDSPLVIHGRDGLKYTFHASAVTKMPNLRMAVDKTSVGQMEFTAILKRNTDPTDAAAYYTVASEAYPGDGAFDVGDIPTAAAVAAWGAAPWDAFQTESGWDIAFNLKLSESKADGLGTFDMILQGLDVSAKAMPIGPTVAQVLTALKGNQALGTSLAGDPLVIGAGSPIGSPTVTLTSAALVDSEARWGAQDKRIGQSEWIATGPIGSQFAIDIVTV